MPKKYSKVSLVKCAFKVNLLLRQSLQLDLGMLIGLNPGHLATLSISTSVIRLRQPGDLSLLAAIILIDWAQQTDQPKKRRPRCNGHRNSRNTSQGAQKQRSEGAKSQFHMIKPHYPAAEFIGNVEMDH